MRRLLLAAAAITTALDVQDVAYAVITSSPVAKRKAATTGGMPG